MSKSPAPADRTPAHATFEPNLAGYLAATAMLSAGSLQGQVVSNFQNPYELAGNLNLSGEVSLSGPIGDWSGAFSGPGTTDSVGLISENATPPSSLDFSFSSAFGAGDRVLDFTTTAAGTGNVDFTISNVGFSGDNPAAQFTRNGVSQGGILANNNYSFPVALGESFGFRFTVGYAFSVPGSLNLSISAFQAPVPEPAAFGLWMGAGALGMVAIREFRRKRQPGSRAV